jgi:hypothetical protein
LENLDSIINALQQSLHILPKKTLLNTPWGTCSTWNLNNLWALYLTCHIDDKWNIDMDTSCTKLTSSYECWLWAHVRQFLQRCSHKDLMLWRRMNRDFVLCDIPYIAREDVGNWMCIYIYSTHNSQYTLFVANNVQYPKNVTNKLN